MKDDLISRQAVLDIAKASKSNWIDNSVLFKRVNELPSVNPQKTQMIDKSNFDQEQYKADLQCAYDCGKASVTPQEPKTGHWEHTTNIFGEEIVICSECKNMARQGYMNFCANCGAKMFEPQESEG